VLAHKRQEAKLLQVFDFKVRRGRVFQKNFTNVVFSYSKAQATSIMVDKGLRTDFNAKGRNTANNYFEFEALNQCGAQKISSRTGSSSKGFEF